MKNIIPSLCENGSGYFMSEITKLIKRSKLDVDIIGFNVWNNLSEETQRVLDKLNLST